MTRFFLAILVFCIAAAPASKPVDPLVIRAQELIDSGNFKQIESLVDAELPQVLNDLAKLDTDKLIRLATLREAGKYFARVSAIPAEAKPALRWLVAQPKLAPTLLLSATESDPPDKVLEIFTALFADQKDKLENTPELTAAVCLVWDANERYGIDEYAKIDPTRAVGIMRFYAGVAPKSLPPELLAYVVDNALSEEEINWVSNRYARRADVPAAFAEVMYNEAAYFDRDPKKQVENSYLLSNIHRLGGRCADQAYFAAQVGKTVGIGTVVCNARGDEEASPGGAWTGYLQPAGRGFAWNFNAARYPEHDGWPAEMIDPQTMNPVPPADAEILSELASTNPVQRMASAALFKVRDFGGGSRKFELLMKAIELSPGNRPAWFALADLSDGGKLSVPQSAQVIEKIKLLLLRSHPEFALRLRLRMIEHRPRDLQLAELAGMSKWFTRADLVGQTKLVAADLHLADKQNDAALAACGEAVACGSPAISYMAMLRANRILKDEQPERLAEIYGSVFNQIRPPRPSGHAHTTAFDLIGRRYAELLDELKRSNDATIVRTKVDAAVSAGTRR